MNTHFDTGIGHAVSLVSLPVNEREENYLRVPHGLLYDLRAVRRYNLCLGSFEIRIDLQNINGYMQMTFRLPLPKSKPMSSGSEVDLANQKPASFTIQPSDPHRNDRVAIPPIKIVLFIVTP